MTTAERIEELKGELADIKTARKNLLLNGQSYTIIGSHTSQSVTMNELMTREKQVKAELLQILFPGRTATTTADFSGVA